MAITQSDIKLMASQDLTDRDDAGGRMTGNEIVDGNVNNLFPDISRLDRVYGRVSMRKGFVFVDTEDNDTYYGAHSILTDPPDDPLVSTVMFSTDSPTDLREDARDRVESYVVQSVLYPGFLLFDQHAGQRAIQIAQDEKADLPRAGDVLFLDGGDMEQYVRIVSLEHEVRDYYDLSNRHWKMRVVTCDLSDPLEYTFPGGEPSYNRTNSGAGVYTTQVADAASYYGVTKLAAPLTSGDLNIQVDTIFASLVPSAQAETALADIVPGGSNITAISAGGDPVTINGSTSIESGLTLYPGPFKNGSLSLTIGGYSWTSQGKDLVRSGNVEGRCDASSGEVLYLGPDLGSQTFAMTFTPAGPREQVNNSLSIEVELSNRGYNYIKTLHPTPEPGTIVVDYMSQKNWYRLTDNGYGVLVPEREGTGTGVINYETGTVTLTCAALPDVGSRVMYYWGTRAGSKGFAEMESGDFEANDDVGYTVSLADNAIWPGSITLTWTDSSGTEHSISDDGAGNFNAPGELIGSADYPDGDIKIAPTSLPASGTWNAAYSDSSHAKSSLAGTAADFIGGASIGGQVKSGTHWFRMTSIASIPSVGDVTINASLYLDGSGNIEWRPYIARVFSGTFNDRQISTLSISFANVVIGTHYVDGGETHFDITGTSLNPAVDYSLYYFEENAADGHQYSEVAHENLNGNCPVALGAVTGSWIEFAASESTSHTTTFEQPGFTANFWPVNVAPVVPGSVMFEMDGHKYRDRSGVLFKDISPITNSGTRVGEIDYTTGTITFDEGAEIGGLETATIEGLLLDIQEQSLAHIVFRTPGAPIRPSSVNLQCRSTVDDVLHVFSSNTDGDILGDYARGTINHETGVVEIFFGEWVPVADALDEDWYDASMNQGSGAEEQAWKPKFMRASTIFYNCVVYSYLPLSADLIGLDPVRLPQDGRVPIFRKGDIAVIHHTEVEQLPNPLSQGQTVGLSRGDLSSIEVYDADGIWVPEAGNYTVDLTAGEITFANPLDLSGFTQPLQARHRREDMILLGDVQINGTMSAVAQITHDYPADETLVSSVLAFGDLQSAVRNEFTQQTWTSVWSDDRIGSGTTAQFNLTQYPITTTNKGAIGERWALIFTDASTFQIAGETTGIIGVGYTSTDTAPVNPATGVPYFSVPHEGWGSGWSTGNVLRFNTEAAHAPIWVVRTTLQGPETESEDSFTMQLRGDAD